MDSQLKRGHIQKTYKYVEPDLGLNSTMNLDDHLTQLKAGTPHDKLITCVNKNRTALPLPLREWSVDSCKIDFARFVSAKAEFPKISGEGPLMVTIDPQLPHPFPAPIAKKIVKTRKFKRRTMPEVPITKIQQVMPLKQDVEYICGWFAITHEAGGRWIRNFTGPIDEDQVDQFHLEKLSNSVEYSMERVISAFERGQTIKSITRQNNHVEIVVPPGQSSQFVILHDVRDTAKPSTETSIPSTEENLIAGKVLFKSGPHWFPETYKPEPTGRTNIHYSEPLFIGRTYETGWFAIKRDGGKITEFTGPIDEDQVEQFSFEEDSYFQCTSCAMKKVQLAFRCGESIESINRHNKHVEIVIPPGKGVQFVILLNVKL